MRPIIAFIVISFLIASTAVTPMLFGAELGDLKSKLAGHEIAPPTDAAGHHAVASPIRAGSKAKARRMAQVWLTTADPKSEPAVGLSPDRRLTRMADLPFGECSCGPDHVVNIDENRKYQQMDGFGISLTDSASWLLNYKLDKKTRAAVMDKLFGKAGISLSMLRQPIGSSDFAWQTYTYDDARGDRSLERFSVSRDEPYIIPVIKEALQRNPGIKIIATPWSAPAWMKYKTNKANGNGKLKAENYPIYARYFVKFIEAYRDFGIPIYAVTPQNEPLFEPAKYPGMKMHEEDQIGMIGDYLGPALEDAGLDTLVIAYDHNYDRADFPEKVIGGLKERGKAHYVAGSAFHHYGGDVSAMSKLHDAHPDKEIWFSEGGFGDWNDPADGTTRGFDNMIREFISITRNWSKSLILWNAALDQKDGPSVIGAKNTNKGMLTIQNSDDRSDRPENRVTYMKQYYLLGHFSKFVSPGAFRIDSDTSDKLMSVAFRNADGSCAVILYNPQAVARTVEIRSNGRAVRYLMPAVSVVTMKW